MTTTAWAHLPNARHIDAVLADVRERPEAWALGFATVPIAVWDRAWKMSWNLASHSGRQEARDAARDATVGFSGVCTRDVIGALIAWDSSADLLDCTPDVLRTMIDLAAPPVCHQAALLLPYAIVRFGT